MKLFKTVFAATAIAAMFSSCTDLAEATDEELADKGITRNEQMIYNAYGYGVSGLNVVTNTLIGGAVDPIKGTISYAATDSAIVDFKTINSLNHATTLQPKLKSLNGTMYATITADEYAAAAKSIKTFAEKIKTIADTKANLSEITYDAGAVSYFVARLGKEGARGYALVTVKSFDAEFNGTGLNSKGETVDVGGKNKDNLGKASIEYYYVSQADAGKTYK